MNADLRKTHLTFYSVSRFMYSTTRSCAVEPMFINNEPEDVSYYYCDTNLCNTASTRQLAGVLALLAVPFFIVF